MSKITVCKNKKKTRCKIDYCDIQYKNNQSVTLEENSFLLIKKSKLNIVFFIFGWFFLVLYWLFRAAFASLFEDFETKGIKRWKIIKICYGKILSEEIKINLSNNYIDIGGLEVTLILVNGEEWLNTKK